MADFTAEQWALRLDELVGGRMRQYLERTLVRTSLIAEREGKENARTRMRVRSGRLRSSLAGRVEAKRGDVLVTLKAGGRVDGEQVSYAAIQEFGGTVRPKKGRYLAIPLDPALTGAKNARVSPRMVPDLMPYRTESGKLLLVKKRGEEIEPWFALVRSVTIKPKHYMRDAMAEAQKSVPDSVKKATDGAVLDG